MTTAHGGFYINCGALEFRAADRRSLVHNNNNNNNSDDEESSESSEEDTEDVDSPKRVEKRIISSSDDDETEDITTDNPRKVIDFKYIRYCLFMSIILYNVMPIDRDEKLRKIARRKSITRMAKKGKNRKIIRRRMHNNKILNKIWIF